MTPERYCDRQGHLLDAASGYPTVKQLFESFCRNETREVLELLASLPTPSEILALRLSDVVQAEIAALREKNRSRGLNLVEQRLWQHYEFVEHLVRMAKAQALLKLGVRLIQPV